MIADLAAHRCPNAQILVNRILEAFKASTENELFINTIEPSLQRSVAGRIAGYDLPFEIAEVKTRPILQVDLDRWHEQFDEEDTEDVTSVSIIKIVKNENQSVEVG